MIIDSHAAFIKSAPLSAIVYVAACACALGINGWKIESLEYK
jgi:hypothetical protein